MADYRKEFPDYPEDQMPALPEGWEDVSWHNDACPAFRRIIHGEVGVTIYVDYAEAAEREFPECDRFVVFLSHDDGALEDEPRESFEGLAEALAFADKLALGEAFP